ncbi:vomeronasal type-2 receptor 116-like [Apodemus sylvaticus]|uniref:vomeronasal type-2 receptor 116-like n=1 Tax=Apodemus sylvaticus TaxID=10129 RepID=UPI0022436106|nr:vomeronasal type-2 receptor 116-like [Apodemus sylvaticus]
MLFSWLFIFWFLQMRTPIWIIAAPFGLTESEHVLQRDGSVVIGAFFPLVSDSASSLEIDWKTLPLGTSNDVWMDIRNYQLVLAMLFAINEINLNPHVLPNTSPGLEIYDLPDTERNILKSVFYWLTGLSIFIPNYNYRKKWKSAATLTGISWKSSEIIGTLLGLYKFPQLTVGRFDHAEIDTNQFTSVYQVAPKDTALFCGIASLMLHFSWTWVGLLITDDHKGSKFASDFRMEMEKNKACIAFVETASYVGESIFHSLTYDQMHTLESSADVIVIYGPTDFLLTVIINIYRKYTMNKIWVMNKKWIVPTIQPYSMLHLSHGALTFSPHHGEIVGFTKFLQETNPVKYPEDTLLHSLWMIFFNCSRLHSESKIIENCLPNASLGLLPRSLFEMVMTEESYNVYNAVYAVAHSLHEKNLNQIQFQPQANIDRTLSFPWQLHPFLKNIQVKNSVGDPVVLDWKRKADPEYDINNIWDFPSGLSLLVKVGTFVPSASKGKQLMISDYMINWPIGFTEIPRSVCSESCSPGFRKVVLEGRPTCCFDCSPCPDNEISNETGMDQCVHCPETHYTNAEKTHCLEKTVTFLAYDDPLGKGLTFVSFGFSTLTALVIGVFVNHRDTPVVKANNRSLSYILLITLTLCFLCPLLFLGLPHTATCILQQNVFGLLFTVTLSTVLAKTITVVMAFKITAPRRKIRWLQISQVSKCVIPACTLIQVLLSAIWLGTSPPFIDMDAHSEQGHIIILCNKGSAVAFHCALAYLGVMALGSYLMAFLSRNLPDTFNESKSMAFSMLVFCSVWVTFLPVYHSTTGKVRVAMEMFSILASSASILIVIFVPKCYIVLFRPELNTLPRNRDERHHRGKYLLKT